MDLVFLEPYDGGSHRAFREGWVDRSRHRFRCLTQPARFWKWRMRGSAAVFADELNRRNNRDNPADPTPDLIFATGFLNVADLRGLLRPPLDRVPIVLYLHENQLTYPLSPEEEFDFHFGFTNIISALAAQRVVFNSEYQRRLFLDAIPAFLGKMPEGVPRQVPARLEAKSEVLGVGLERRPLPAEYYPRYRGGPCAADAGPTWPRAERPLIVWNHRWEFDKRPEWFIAAVETLLDEGHDFAVALLGESRNQEGVFHPLAKRLGARCVACGFLPSRAQYDALLERADIVVSCAAQEYFGISVAEAVHAGCYPVLPRDQVYPSLYGARCKGRHLYDTPRELTALLRDLITGGTCGHVCSLDRDVDEFCWERLAPRFDALVDRVVSGGPQG
ncbi:glycosyl transferase family 1 [bacterium DOLJORAL78_65_58]|nr:MAG: glycosyl transferase family 1 [bacterium DOLZORAL124_64_63]PIE76042.1 MAG: glycosyl transferase family 1 [bacterium DOLJORAL78_65_58]